MTTLSTMRRTLIAALALSPVLAAAQAPKEQPPAPAAPKSFRLADHRTFTMKNGMRVTLIHYGSVPKAVVQLEIRTGAIDEPPYGPGLAGLAAEMLLQGTVARSAVRISRDGAGRRTDGAAHIGREIGRAHV